MANFFPPKPVYPKKYDSDTTLFLVYNTSETVTTQNNNPWSDEISIKPVDDDRPEIWADNGFATINGELFYYDGVEKKEPLGDGVVLGRIKVDSSGGIVSIPVVAGGSGYFYPVIKVNGDGSGAKVEAVVKNGVITAFNIIQAGKGYKPLTTSLSFEGRVIKFKRCSRNLGGTHTKFNSSGAEVRGFVIAEHHNQIADSIIKTEDFIGINFDPRKETLDWRIRNLQNLPIIFDDYTCPDVSFSFYVVSEDPAVGTTIQYDVVINGTFTGYNLTFGDGQSTSVSFSGTHVYATSSTIDPIVTVQSESCTIVQTPVTRDLSSEPVVPPTEPGFSINIPVIPEIPPFIFPSIPIPSTPQIPPIVFPCLDIGTIGPVNIPSVISFVPEIALPSIITFEPVLDIPSLITVDVPSLPSIPTLISVDIPSISIPSIPTLISVAIPSISIPSIPTLISVAIPSIPNIPTLISIVAPPIPTLISIVGCQIPSIIEMSWTDPTQYSWWQYFKISWDDPTQYSWWQNAWFVSWTDPTQYSWWQHAWFVSWTDPTQYSWWEHSWYVSWVNPESYSWWDKTWWVSFADPPAISVVWDPVPTVSCVVTVQCPGSTSFIGSNLDNIDTEGLDPGLMELSVGDIGIPSEIKVVFPDEIPDIKLIHDVPAIIRVASPDIPSEINIKMVEKLPSEIRIISEDVPTLIEISAKNIPSYIEIDASNIPRSISIDVPSNLPSIKLDASQIPDKIQVVGIPSTIELVGAPSEIKLVLPEKPEIELVYKGSPIDVKINLDVGRLTGENDKSQCVAIVPCGNQ